MDIIGFAISNPVKVAVGVLLIILFGFIALGVIPIQLTPDVDKPIITITTEWPGRSPEEVEREIIEEQEDVLKDISGLRKMTATAFQGRGQIELEFLLETDIKAAKQDVSDSLREVPEYPDQADEPVIEEGEAGAGSPIAWTILTSEDDGFNPQSLGDPAEDRIKPFLEKTPGVSEVRVFGGREREVHIEVDPAKVAQRGITFNQFFQQIQSENLNISAGDVPEGQYDVRIRVLGQYDELDQIRETIIAYDDNGGPIRVKDVAEVTLTLEKRRSFVRSRGNVALAMPVYRETGANVMDIMTRLRGKLDTVNESMLPAIAQQVAMVDKLDTPPKLKLELVYDETIYIDDAISLVQTNLLIGGTLAVFSLGLFLRKFRPTVVVALAIPISVIGTFLAMAAFGRTLNVISLAGLAFAVGMVVDNAIVVLENIDRHLGMGKKPRQAAYDAGREVWGAILASTLTTLAVFVPVLTVQEEAGQLFRDIALAICAAVTLSLLVSISVIPSASARFLQAERERRNPIIRAFNGLFGLASFLGWLVSRFADFIYLLTGRGAATVMARVAVVGGFTLVALVGAWLLMPPADYLPRGNRNLVFGFVLTPPGYNIEHNEKIAHQVERIMRPYWEAEDYADLKDVDPPIHPFTGQPVQNPPPVDNYFFVSFFGGVFNGGTSEDKENVAPMADLMTAATNQIPGSIGFAQQRSIFGTGRDSSRAIEVEVAGLDLERVTRSASALRGVLIGAYGPMNVQPTPSNFDKAGRELTIKRDPVRASNIGVDVDELGAGVRALVDGLYVGDYRLRGESIDILVVRDPTLEINPEQLESMPLAYTDSRGQRDTIPLSAVATARRTLAPQEIQRIDEQKAVTLVITPPDDVPLEEATAQIDQQIQQLREAGTIPPDVQVTLAGSASKLANVREALLGSWKGWTLASVHSLITSRAFLALLVTYLLMAALFESWIYPFVIMFAVPLATVGGFLGLAITHEFVPTQQLDTLTMLGFVILIGVVVNNAILIVHQALNFMRGLGEGEGDDRGKLAPREAIRASVRSRVRPVFMTTVTSVAGMLPLVLMPGSGSELYRGLGSVVVGGLIVASLFTLIVVPILLSLAMDAQRVCYSLVGATLPEEFGDAEATN